MQTFNFSKKYYIQILLFFMLINLRCDLQAIAIKSCESYPKGIIETIVYNRKSVTFFYVEGSDIRYGYTIGTPKTFKLFAENAGIGDYIERKGNVMKLIRNNITTYWLVNNCNDKFYNDPIRPEYFQDSMLTGGTFNNRIE